MTPVEARKVLGVGPKGSSDDIRRAYLRLAKETHPDRGGSQKAFVQVSDAYEVLTEQERGPGQRQKQGKGNVPEDERPYQVGDFLFLRQLDLDGEPYTSRAKCQISEIDGEIFFLIVLHTPWKGSSGRVTAAMSDNESDPEVAVFQRDVIGRSYDEDQRLVLFWFSPLATRKGVGEAPRPKPMDERFRRPPRTWWVRG